MRVGFRGHRGLPSHPLPWSPKQDQLLSRMGYAANTIGYWGVAEAV